MCSQLNQDVSTVGWLTVGWLQKPEKVEKRKNSLKDKRRKNVSTQPNSSYTLFDQNSPQPPPEGVLQRHRQTGKQTDRRTLQLYD